MFLAAQLLDPTKCSVSLSESRTFGDALHAIYVPFVDTTVEASDMVNVAVVMVMVGGGDER